MTFDQWWESYMKIAENAPLSDYEMDVARDAWNACQSNANIELKDLRRQMRNLRDRGDANKPTVIG